MIDIEIYKKQAKNFNIISHFPEMSHELREYHKLSTETKYGSHLHPQPPVPEHNPEHHH